MNKNAIYIKILTLMLWSFGCQQEYSKEQSEAVKQAEAVLQASERGYLDAAAQSEQAVERFYARPSWKRQWREWFEQRDQLLPIQYRQFSALLYTSAGVPPDAEAKRRLQAAAEGLSFPDEWQRQEDIAANTKSLRAKEALCAKARRLLGDSSASSLREYAQLRNDFAALGGYADYYAYRADAYQFSEQEMTKWRQSILLAVRPLMQELHTWLRYELAKEYRQMPPEKIPSYWLKSWSGYEWSRESKGLSGMGKPIEGLPLKQLWLAQGEAFKNCGFQPLPESSLRLGSPAPNLYQVKSFPQVQPKVRIDSAAVGHNGWKAMAKARVEALAINSSRNPDVPLLLQTPACPAFIPAWRQGMEQLLRRQLIKMDSAKMQDSTLRHQWEQRLLLEEALEYIPKLAFYAGVLGDFEQSLYAGNLSTETYTPRWNNLMQRYLGVDPDQELAGYLPTFLHRKEFLAGGAMDTTVSIAMQYQLQGRLALSDSSSKMFQRFFYPGASLRWKEIYAELEMTPPTGRAIQQYFEPLIVWLREQNAQRKSTLPDWRLGED